VDSRSGKQTPDWELLAPGTARNAPARQQLPAELGGIGVAPNNMECVIVLV
jgi:hypothetical protein